MSQLVLHRGARIVQPDELVTVEAPPPTDTWFPLKHGIVLNRVTETLTASGYEIQKQSLALSADNQRFFATLDLQANVMEGVNLSIGIRNSTDKSLPIGFCAGERI